ncbi:repressor LexA [Boudabousia liubingyangii]|uniref:transcriptional repressor LexA n=1 Tax=Boudabousia liubingyangii TaxID=1921764 RepID=UPI00093B54C5|nr:transcriptional repressor LexA [Boudabousia liubingyangii]OKL47528.1 repressor LexA [Boudabousia liubingyangii]
MKPKSPASKSGSNDLDRSTLTGRQLDILRYLEACARSGQHVPTVREIATAVGLSSPSSVKHQLDTLEELGFISRDERRARALKVNTLEDSGSTTSTSAPAPTSSPAPTSLPNFPGLDPEQLFVDSTPVPLVGHIAAGKPITAIEEIEDTFVLPQRLTGKGNLFMLEVEGDSMIEAAICDGDWVVVRQQNNAEFGEIVAAMIDGEATVKVWSRKDGHYWLLPCNENYAPIPADQAQILGKVVTVLRSL